MLPVTHHAASFSASAIAATALIGHHFWTMEGPGRTANAINFYKNISIIGGFLVRGAKLLATLQFPLAPIRRDRLSAVCAAAAHPFRTKPPRA